MIYNIRNVRDHVEVFDRQGNFVLSADNQQEALDELLREDTDAAVA
ncbi:hypothetical protein LJC60_11035 [Ruminococcaceae bacterium OttesenSCG-928-D13]|nr:hypothetical protein [Ruminococcaceae bacterium OttesenSCG-928-D13]